LIMGEDAGFSSGRPSSVVGREIRLKDLIMERDVTPLFELFRKAGVRWAAITDERNEILWELDGSRTSPGLYGVEESASGQRAGDSIRGPLKFEGETVGSFLLEAPPGMEADAGLYLKEFAELFCRTVITHSSKRIQATETHAAVVSQSYEELVETNRKLVMSERKYRELAGALEEMVEKRTEELKKTHTKLLQKEKMASVGQLAAGIAHEINNPVGFIKSDLCTFRNYKDKLREAMSFYRGLVPGLPEPLMRQAVELERRLKMDFVLEDMGSLIEECLSGAERIAKIVENMKNFSHIDEVAEREMSLRDEIEKVIRVLSHETAARSASIETEYGPVPSLFGNPGLVGQAFFNILLNALESREKGVSIRVRTEETPDTILVSISDTGRGIPKESLRRIFDPFFTTKDVGTGLGMGLALSYEIVTAHGGTIDVVSEPGKGSTFVVALPRKGARDVQVRTPL